MTPLYRANWRWREGDGDDHAGGPAVVFDIDGVLSDAAGRQHYLERGRRDWDALFAACGDDPLIAEVGRLLGLLERELAIILLTGRPLSVQATTVAWLNRYGLRWDLLIMRDVSDYSAATQFKRRSVGELRDAGFDLRLAFEDDRRNVAMFHNQGVPCVYLHSGYFE